MGETKALWLRMNMLKGYAQCEELLVFNKITYCPELWPRGPRPIFEGGATITNIKKLLLF